MEVVMGIGEEAKPKACSSEIEQGSGEKTLKDDTDVAQENGVRVSVNGVENLNDSGASEDCMMNGVSSLLKLNQITENIPKDEEDEDEEDEESEEEEEHGYHVGDFVWGKIKNHPWWPGQIYDPSEASDLALKIKQKGKLLVAYFGDGTFAWCGPSQLKPFAEGFQECSKVSNSKSFLGAVEEAVEELGRHIERLLICDCAEEKHKFDNPEAKNAGIKEGVFVRDARREIISSLLIGKPGGILEDVKSFAETVSFSGLLELEILKRKVSAFYWSKRGFGLPEYHEPQSVPGLEDKNNDDDDDEGVKWRRSGANRSSKEEDKEADEKAGLDLEKSLQRSLEKCSSGFPDHRLLHRRKLKSIAEILENESAAKVRFKIEPEDGDVKLSKKKLKRCDEHATVTATTPRSRKMSEVSTIEDDSHNHVEASSKGKKNSRKRKKSDVDDDENVDREETEKNEISDSEIDIDSAPLASLRRKVRDDASSVERTAGNGETATQTSSKRERKKSKYFSPDFLSDFSSKWRKSKTKSESSKVSTQSQAGQQMAGASDRILAMEEDKLDKPCEPSLANGVDHQELSEELRNAVDFLRLGATSMEMRDLIRVAALGTQYPEDSSSKDMVREFMSIYRSFTYHEGANSKFLGTCDSSGKEKDELNETGFEPESKGKERKDKKRKAKEQTEEVEQIGKEENETDKHGTSKKEGKPKKSKSKKQRDEEEEEETLKEATKKPISEKKGDKEERETLEEASVSTKNERKRKKPETKKQGDGEEGTLKGSSASTKEERKSKKPKLKEEETRNKTVEPVKKKEREGKSKKEDTEKEFAGAELLITFGPGSSLPKKEELIKIYEKIGLLEEERTDILYNNFSGRVAFVNIADGEKAFESSQEKCPFASPSTVKFRLKYPNERTEEKKAEAEVAEKTMEKEYVKKKLEEMRSLVDECEGGITEEVKVKFEDEMRNLLEKVKKMSSS